MRTSNCEFSAADLREAYPGFALAPGGFVRLEVADTGCGMPKEMHARIFEPFFTTKFSGHGLGLAATLGIIKSHHGAIRVQSAPGAGTTFQIIFPSRGIRPTPPTAELSLPAGLVGSGIALVVDDQSFVRDVTTRFLERIGFTPIVAVDGVEGVAAFRQHAGQVRLILLDLAMPRMDGTEALAEIRRLDPAVPIILMSGFSQKLTIDNFAETRPSGIIAKPFDLEMLKARIEAVLRTSAR
jgi:CheY-like chemotaxis protein